MHAKQYKCSYCGLEWHKNKLQKATVMAQQPNEDGELPAGACPECAGLVYYSPYTGTLPITLHAYVKEEIQGETYLDSVDSDQEDVPVEQVVEIVQAALTLLTARAFGLDLDPYLTDLQIVAGSLAEVGPADVEEDDEEDDEED